MEWYYALTAEHTDTSLGADIGMSDHLMSQAFSLVPRPGNLAIAVVISGDVDVLRVQTALDHLVSHDASMQNSEILWSTV